MFTRILFAIAGTIGSGITTVAKWWVEQRDCAQKNLFTWATEGTLTRLTLWFLLMRGIDVNARDEDEWTALMCASMNGHTEVVRTLLEGGTDVDVRDNDGWTALIWASSEGHTEVVRTLLAGGADVNARDENGCGALIFALMNSHMKVVDILSEYDTE